MINQFFHPIASPIHSQYVIPYEYSPCSIPQTLQGEWFSREHGENILTIIDSSSFSTHGRCIDMASYQFDNFTFVLQQGTCYHCVRLLVRTLNVLEKIDTGCINLNYNDRPSMSSICRNLDPNQELVTMFCMYQKYRTFPEKYTDFSLVFDPNFSRF